MAGRILMASIISAVFMFLWGFVFWGVLDVGSSVLKPLPAEMDVLAVLRNSQAPSGMYVYPVPVSHDDEEAIVEWTRKHEEGPLLSMAYRAEGGPPMPPKMFAQGLGVNFAVALFTSLLVAMASGGLPTFGKRFAFVLLVSLVSAIWTNVGDVVWWFHSVRYCLGNMAYTVGAGLVMALVVAAIVRQTSTTTE